MCSGFRLEREHQMRFIFHCWGLWWYLDDDCWRQYYTCIMLSTIPGVEFMFIQSIQVKLTLEKMTIPPSPRHSQYPCDVKPLVPLSLSVSHPACPTPFHSLAISLTTADSSGMFQAHPAHLKPNTSLSFFPSPVLFFHSCDNLWRVKENMTGLTTCNGPHPMRKLPPGMCVCVCV